MGGIVNQDIHTGRSVRLAMPQMVDETDISLTCELLTLLEDDRDPSLVPAFLGRLATGFQFECVAVYRCVPQDWPNASLDQCLGSNPLLKDNGILHPTVTRALHKNPDSPLYLHPRTGVRYSFDTLFPELAKRNWSGLAVALCFNQEFYGTLLFAGKDVGLTSRLKENLLVRLCNALCRTVYARITPTENVSTEVSQVLKPPGEMPRVMSAQALKSMDRAVVLTDTERNIIAMNSAAEHLTQWQESDAIGQPLEFIVHLVSDRFNQRQRPSPGPTAKRYVLIQKNGQSIPVESEVVPIIDAQGQHQGYIASFKCETENRLVERALIRTKEEQRLLIERLPMGIVILQGDAIAYSNPAWQDMLTPCSQNSFVGTRITTLLHPDDLASLKERQDSDERTVGPLPPGLLRFRRSDHTYANLDVFKAQVVEFNGVLSILLTVMDCTETQRMRSQLAVSEHLASVGTLAAGLAHEINNPMTYLLDNLAQLNQMVRREDIVVPLSIRQNLYRNLGEAKDGAVRVRDIVRELKFLERETEAAPIPTSVFDTVQSATHLVGHQTARNIILNHRCETVPKVLGSSKKLTQVFMNLLMALDGLIDDASSPIHIELYIREEQVLTEFSTTYQVHEHERSIPAMVNGTSRSLSLGLMVSEHIIQDLGGTLQWLKGHPEGQGIQVRLPMSLDTVHTHQGTTTTDERVPSSLRILVVDDESLVARALKRSLKHHHVQIVSKGAEALKRFRTETFDIVFCDVMMPEMNGPQLLGITKELYPELAQRIIFMSGGIFQKDIAALLAQEPNLVIEKPFVMQEINDSIASIIHQIP